MKRETCDLPPPPARDPGPAQPEGEEHVHHVLPFVGEVLREDRAGVLPLVGFVMSADEVRQAIGQHLIPATATEPD
jgi:hypothetical protein